jgi:hypothetical protein
MSSFIKKKKKACVLMRNKEFYRCILQFLVNGSDGEVWLLGLCSFILSNCGVKQTVVATKPCVIFLNCAGVWSLHSLSISNAICPNSPV